MFKTARPAALFALASLALAVMLVGFAPEAHAAGLHASDAFAHFGMSGLVMASPILALRATVTDLETRAAAKLAEILPDMAPDAVRAVEAQHAALLTDLAAARTAVVTAEAAERAATPNPAPVNTAAIEAAAVERDRARSAEIRSIGTQARMSETDINAAVSGGTSVEVFRARAFEALAANADRSMTRPVAQFGGQDADESRRSAMTQAIAARLARAGGDRNAQVPEAARAYGEMGLAEIAAECIGHRGNLRTSRQVVEVMERSMHTTSDFPGIFVDALNSRLLARYAVAPATYREFAAPYTSTDFKPTHVVRAGDFPSLQPLNEKGEIRSGTWSESKEIFRVQPYAVDFGITRQMIVNDQLGAIDQMLGASGDAVIRWENTQVFALLTSNPVLLTDNKAVFHADHKNLAGAGAAIAVASVGAGRAAMRKQVSLDGQDLNLSPAILLVGPDNETIAEQLFAQITPNLVGSAVPESFRRLKPVSDNGIKGNEWYLFASPGTAPCFVYGYLEGYEAPRLSFKESWGTQGMRGKLEHDFGAAAIDFRGGYKNGGAA